MAGIPKYWISLLYLIWGLTRALFQSWFCNVIMCICSSLSIVSLGKRGLVLVLLRLCVGMFVCSLVSAIVSLSLGTMDWSVVPECDISWSYSLVCFNNTDTLQIQLIDNN